MSSYLSTIPLIGRCFQNEEFNEEIQHEPKTSQTWDLTDITQKVMGVAFITLLIFGIFIPPVGASPRKFEGKVCSDNTGLTVIPPYLQPYSSQLTLSELPQASHSLKTFPSYLSQVIHPGLMDGTQGHLCVIPENEMPPFNECERVTLKVFEFLKENRPNDHKRILGHKDGREEKGMSVTISNIDSSIEMVALGMNPIKIKNYRQVIAYIEEVVLNNDKFFRKNEKFIVQTIKKVHEIVMNNKPAIRGVFRKDYAIVRDDKTQPNLRSFLDALIRKGGSAKEQKDLQSGFTQLNSGGSFEYFTVDQMNAFRKVAFIPCSPKEINDKMLEFAKQIKELGVKVKNREIDAVAAAAYVHQEIGNIHPFADGNGRIARLWMNVMLQVGGIKAIVFPSNDKYTQEVIKDQQSPGSFAPYLEEVIKWNSNQEALSLEDLS